MILKSKNIFPLFFILLFFYCSCGNPRNSSHLDYTNTPPSQFLEEIADNWVPVLGLDGGFIADLVVSQFSPECTYFNTPQELEIFADDLRNKIINGIGLETNRNIISIQRQKKAILDEFRIEVIKLEVFPNYYLPINVYIPNLAINQSVPLVLIPPGCVGATWSEETQLLASNLALMGIAVITTEGYCFNGVRSDFTESFSTIGYIRQLFGLRGDVTIFLQELVSTINWALDEYEFIDETRIGVTGFSYGGLMSMLLASLDPRIASISVPATGYIGNPMTGYYGNICNNFQLRADKSYGYENYENFVYRPPVEYPILPVNISIPLIYPTPILTTVSENDFNNSPNFMDGLMNYSFEIYSIDNFESRISYNKDSEKHIYNKIRREYTYGWFYHTLLNGPLINILEVDFPLLDPKDLTVDISGSRTLTDDLRDLIQERSSNPETENEIKERILIFLTSSFPKNKNENKIISSGLINTLILNSLDIEFHKFNSEFFSFPIFIFKNKNEAKQRVLLFLPERGTFNDLSTILEQLGNYKTIISIDYLGIGELESVRLSLETLSSYFMFNDPTLPQINIGLIYSFITYYINQNIDIFGNGWVSSLYALILKLLEGESINNIVISGVPNNEFEYFNSGQKFPELIFWGGLYKSLSISELIKVIKNGKVIIN